MTFASTEDTLDGVHVLHLHGEVDVSCMTSARAAIAHLFERPGPHVLDLSGVDFLDSSGLKLLDESQTVAAEHGARVEIVCPPGRVFRLLQITGVDDYLPVHASIDRAAAALRG